MSTLPAAAPIPRAWLKAVLSPWTRRLALAAFAASFFFPVTGLGPDLCPIHRATGLPCPGCGMTRAVALVSQGEPLLALGANPFVVLVWPLMLTLAVLALLRHRQVLALEAKLDATEPYFSRLQAVLLASFLGFGVLRFAVFLALREPFP